MYVQSQRLLCGMLFLLLLTSQSSGQSSIDTSIVLRVGTIHFTGYELEKNLTQFRDIFRQKNGRTPTAADIGQGIQAFIDRGYLLADASAKRYDTLTEVNRWVAAMERFIISQPGGLLDEKLGGELTEQDLNQAVQKHLRKLHYRYIRFPDHAAAFTMLEGKATVESNAAFEDLVKKRSAITGVSIGQDVVQWPFFNRGVREELLLDLKEGEISSLITLSDGVYLAQAMRIEIVTPADLPPNYKQVLTGILKQRKQEEVHRKFYEESMHHAAIKYDEPFLAALKEYLAAKGSISNFEKDMFPSVRYRTAMTYQVGNTAKQISGDEWMSYYNHLPMKQAIRTESLLPNLEAFIIEDLAYHKAQETGITKDTKFVLDRINYEKNIIAVIYEREELKKGIVVTDEEISSKYQQAKDEYRQATDAVVTALSFPDRRSASQGYALARSGRIDSLIKTNAIEAHRSIRYNDALFTDSIRNVIFAAKVSTPSSPLYYKGNWIFIIKESESGNRTRELEEVKSTLIKKIEEEKLEEKKQALLAILKKKYPVFNGINSANYHIKLQ